MLLRIEVFPPAGKAQTLYASPSTVANRFGTTAQENNDNSDDDATVDGDDGGNNPNAGLVATIGRKGDVDILFGMDRSISRQHALLRFVAPKIEKPRGRKEKANDESSSNEGCFMKPRNKTEELACKNSPYGMCLVLENRGKSGSYISSKDETFSGNNKQEETAHDSDVTTDDEGTRSNGQSTSQSNNYGTATSLTTQLGEVIVSVVDDDDKRSSSQKLPPLSDAIRDHFGSETPVRLTKLDADESQVLEFEKSDSSVLVQFGCAQLPTIKITRIPMVVVFSSGVSSAIQDSLRLCGGLCQESLPCKGETTHLVTTERMAVAKQLIAWCYGIPIVSPDFVVALRKHSSLADPFSSAKDFPAKATDTNAFWGWNPNPKLLGNYIMLSVDPSPEVEQAEGLSRAAGAVVEELYDPKKKPTKAKVQTFLKRTKELIKEAESVEKTVVLLSSKTKSKWSNTNTTFLLKQLAELSVSPVSTKMLAKTITKQESILVGLEPKANHRKSDTNSAKGRRKNKAGISETAILDESEAPPKKTPASPHSPEWDLRTMERPNLKREHEEAVKEKGAYKDGYVGDEKNSNEINKEKEKTVVEESPSHSRSSKRRKVDRQEQALEENEEETDFILSTNNDEMTLETRSGDSPLPTDKKKNRKINRDFKADSNGWFHAAPNDDRERLRLRQRAGEAYQKKTGMVLEPSASTGHEVIRVVTPSAMTDSTNQPNHSTARVRPTNTNVPNFKRFRKNNVPIVREVITLVDASFTQASHDTQEPSAEELELRENQRIAEALFSGESVPGMVQKRKRARK